MSRPSPSDKAQIAALIMAIRSYRELILCCRTSLLFAPLPGECGKLLMQNELRAHSALMKATLEGAEQRAVSQSLSAGSKLAVDFFFSINFDETEKKN